MTATGALRCGIVGGGRTRNGLGPFLVRDLEAAGAQVVAVAGRDPGRTAAVAAEFAAAHGHPVAPYDAVPAMLAAAALDVLVVAAPIPAHLPALQQALASGVAAILCEKPLVRPTEHEQVPGLLDALAERGVLVVENCPWPRTLHVFPQLYPELAGAPVEDVEMRLSPSGRGDFMLVDSLSHFLSVIQHLVPVDASTRLAALSIEGRGPATDRLEIDLALESPFPRLRARLYLRQCATQPRPAWVAVNGKRAVRQIEPRDYSISFRAGERSITVVDPMSALVRDFVQLVREPDLDRTRAESTAIRERARLYHTILGGDAWGDGAS